MDAKLAARVVGIFFLLLGVLGFIPGIATDDMLLGTFAVNVWHNLLLIGTGLIGIGAGFTTTIDAKGYFQALTIFYGVLATLGFVLSPPLLGFLAVNRAGTFTHLLLALFSLYIGFFEREEHSRGKEEGGPVQ